MHRPDAGVEVTLLAGAFRRRGALQQADDLLAAMKRHLSRNPSDRLEVVRDDCALLVKVDIGALKSKGLVDEADAVTFVAGEPIVSSLDPSQRSRATDTAELHRMLQDREYMRLAEARGAFSVAHYDRASKRLVIATDKLGIRPMYVWTDGDTVVYSSTIRLLEACVLLPKTIDFDGLAERVAFGFSFGARTSYANITLLKPGEVVEVTADGITSAEYWRWQDIPRSTKDLATLSRAAYDTFMEAVRIRQRGDNATTAFLSGGLDSRVVVAALRNDDVDVHSFNFSPEGTEDREYGAALAQVAGTTHESHGVDDPIDSRWSMMIANAHAKSTAAIKSRVERPQVMWSGDGGSVTLGHVYLRPTIMERAAAGDLDAVADEYLQAEHGYVPLRLLQPSIVPRMAEAPRNGVIAELKRLHAGDLSQTFYLFLMQNDQHRHLHHHFEGIDEHRVELQLPFFDSEFAAIIASIPIEARLYHAFYVSWLNEFPEYVSKTYWQAYPGHVPCPIPPTKALDYQWAPSVLAAKRALIRRKTMRRAWATLRSPNFASSLMKKYVLSVAAAVHWSTLSNRDYVVDAADTIQKTWDVTMSHSS
ncbi:MAG: asparagine synthase-related protein [bacterium]